jgi:hypothetical protein
VPGGKAERNTHGHDNFSFVRRMPTSEQPVGSDDEGVGVIIEVKL